jgi:hypothetical protein
MMMMVIIIIRSTGSDYVSEMWPPAGLLLIPQTIYEHGEPRWNKISREKLLILQPEVSDKYQQRHLAAKQEEVAK